jgi:DNA-binding NarL/FixJ family response regulator
MRAARPRGMISSDEEAQLVRDPEGRSARVMIVDDDARARSALSLLLEQELGARVVAVLADGGDVETAVADGRPHLVVLDWSLRGPDVAAAIAAARASGAAVVTLADRSEQRAAALAAGADAVVYRGDGPTALLAACRPWCALAPERRVA